MAAFDRDSCSVRQVWAWNLRAEFFALFETLRSAAHVAFDTEFPGCVREGPWTAAPAAQYAALRCNVGMLRPIQLGLAVSDAQGTVLGVWSFNLLFNLDRDLHTEAAVSFLRDAGIDFPRHAAEGVDAKVLGRLLVRSSLVGSQAPWWITFSGLYDLGYMVNLLTDSQLPRTFEEFQTILDSLCPKRHELRDWLPHGSLQNLALERGVERRGAAHTAGSDALATMELFLSIMPPGMPSADEDDSDQEPPRFGPPGLSLPLPPGTGAAPAATWGASARLAALAVRRPGEVHVADLAAGPPLRSMPSAPMSLWGAAAHQAVQLRTRPGAMQPRAIAA